MSVTELEVKKTNTHIPVNPAAVWQNLFILLSSIYQLLIKTTQSLTFYLVFVTQLKVDSN